jgi:predicted DNA-binding transcriptional regulator AlpA
LKLECLPSPFKFGRRCYWRERDIDDHLEELIRNTRDE